MIVTHEDFAKITGSADPLVSAYRSLDVERYHTQADVPAQTLADHSARVALLVMMIWPRARPEVTQYAIVHDIGEKITGDLPYTTKLILPEEALNAIDALEDDYVKSFLGISIPLAPHEKAMVKVCDYLELMLYCMQFETRGARQIAKTGAELVGKYAKALKPDDRAALSNALGTHFFTSLESHPDVHHALSRSLAVLV